MEMMAFRRTRRNELPINADCRRSHKASFSSFFFPLLLLSPFPPVERVTCARASIRGRGRLGENNLHTPSLSCRGTTTSQDVPRPPFLSSPPPLPSITRVVIAKPILPSNVTMRFIRDNLRGRIKGN